MYDPTKPYKEEIKRLVCKTWETEYVSVRNWVMKPKFLFPIYGHGDGIGNKGYYYFIAKTFDKASEDAIAGNMNDLLLVGATPFAVVDNLILPKDDHSAFVEIVRGLVGECKKYNIAIIGGDPAVHSFQDSMEISLAMFGFVKKERENLAHTGDILIGIGSSGLQANGFEKVRELFGGEIRKDFIIPTYNYFEVMNSLLEMTLENQGMDSIIHAMVNITGGAYTKIKEVLFCSDAVIYGDHQLEPLPIFKEICFRMMDDKEMYKIFNCGIGFVFSVDLKYADICIEKIRKAGFKADVVGEIVSGVGKVRIKSKFSKNEFLY